VFTLLIFSFIVWYFVVLYCLDYWFRTLEYKGIPRVLEVFESSGEYEIGKSIDLDIYCWPGGSEAVLIPLLLTLC
jgi:hypothetical protein